MTHEHHPRPSARPEAPRTVPPTATPAPSEAVPGTVPPPEAVPVTVLPPEAVPGTVLRHTRTHTAADLAAYTALTGVAPVGSPPSLPGLLVIAPLTKLGGDLDYLAREMTWTHHRPVAATERLTAELRVHTASPDRGAVRIAFVSRVSTDDGEAVATGRSNGVILGRAANTPRPPSPPTPAHRTPADHTPAHGSPADHTPAHLAPTATPPPTTPPRPRAHLLDPTTLTAGTTLTTTVTITDEDIDRCTELTGDRGAHHVLGLAGRRMAQGVLTAGAVPLLRGEEGFHCATVTAVFHQPVHAGDEIHATTRVTETASTSLEATGSVRNQHGTEVLTTRFTGSFAPAPRSATART